MGGYSNSMNGEVPWPLVSSFSLSFRLSNLLFVCLPRAPPFIQLSYFAQNSIRKINNTEFRKKNVVRTM